MKKLLFIALVLGYSLNTGAQTVSKVKYNKMYIACEADLIPKNAGKAYTKKEMHKAHTIDVIMVSVMLTIFVLFNTTALERK